MRGAQLILAVSFVAALPSAGAADRATYVAACEKWSGQFTAQACGCTYGAMEKAISPGDLANWEAILGKLKLAQNPPPALQKSLENASAALPGAMRSCGLKVD